MNSQMQDFQKSQWIKFFSHDIYDLFKNYSFSYKGVNVELSTDASEFLTSPGNESETISCNLKMDAVVTTEHPGADGVTRYVRHGIVVTDFPILTDSGIKIRGTYYNPISKLSPASGWYIKSDKTGTYLALCRGTRPRLKFIYNPKTKIVNYVVQGYGSKDAEGKQGELVNLFIFLKAVGVQYSYADILKQLRLYPFAVSTFEALKGVEQSANECAAEILSKLNVKLTEDAVGAFSARLFSSNWLRVGHERVIRFKDFTSYLRVVGHKLAKRIELSNGVTFEKGITITDSIATALDDSDVKSIFILHKNRCIEVPKVDIEDTVSYTEIIEAVYLYLLYLDGIGELDLVDNYRNKILMPVSTRYCGYIEDCLSTFTNTIIKNIDNGYQDLSTIIPKTISEDISDKNNIIKEFHSDPDYQQLDRTNSLATFEQSFKVDGAPAGSDNVPDSVREVQPTQFGRICPYTSSESKKVGLNLSLTISAGLDANGFITTPYYKVSNGKRTDTIVNLNAIEEHGRVIALYNVDLSKDLSGEQLSGICHDCHRDGEMCSACYGDIEFQQVSTSQVAGLMNSYIPFASHNAGKRLYMAPQAVRQALPTLRHERMMVSTGLEAKASIGVKHGRDIIREALNGRGYFDCKIPETTTLELVSIGLLSNTTTVVFKTNHPSICSEDSSGKFVVQLPAIGDTTEKSYCHGRVKLKDNDPNYGLDEIAIYNNDVVVDDAKISKSTVAFDGEQLSTKALSESAVALGQNVKVLFKFYEGYGYEDSVVAQDRFTKQQGLATINVFTVKEDLEDATCEKFTNNLSNGLLEFGLNSNGLPLVGSKLKTGQIVIGKVKLIPPREGSGKTAPTKVNCSRKILFDEEGTVVAARIVTSGVAGTKSYKITAVVTIANILPLTVGDKVTGLHGNKGVVSKIVPYHDFPFTEDGVVPDLICNVSGIVSRANVGQCMEGVAGAIAEATNTVQIAPSFESCDISEWLNLAEMHDVREVTLYDGRDGTKFERKAFIGTMYFLRNKHTSASEYNASDPSIGRVSERTGQPYHGPGGGQRISELSTWCFSAYNATDLANTLFSIQSDDVGNKSKLVKSIRAGKALTTNIPYRSYNQDLMQAYFSPLGVDIHPDTNGSPGYFSPINSDAARRIVEASQINTGSNGVVNISTDSRSDAALREEAIFGESSRGNVDFQQARVRYGRIPLGCRIIMTIFLENDTFLNTILYIKEDFNVRSYRWMPAKPDIMKSKMCQEILSGKYYLHGFTEGIPVFRHTLVEGHLEFKLPNKEYILDDARIQEETLKVQDEISSECMKINAFMSIVDNYDVTNTVKFINSEGFLKKAKTSDGATIDNGSLKLNSKVHISDAAKLECRANILEFCKMHSGNTTLLGDKRINWYVDFITDSVVVPPIGFRPSLHGKSGSTALSATLSAIHRGAVAVNSKIGDMPHYYSQIIQLYEIISRASASHLAHNGQNAQYKNLWEEINDHRGSKNSVMRDTCLSKQVDYSLRSVIVNNSKLRMDQVGVPINQVTVIFQDHLIAKLAQDGVGEPWPEWLQNLPVKLNIDTWKEVLIMLANEDIDRFATMALSFEGALRDDEQRLSGITASGVALNGEYLYETFTKCRKELFELLSKLFLEYPGVLNREPSFHKFNMSGVHPIPVDAHAIMMHSLYCRRYNADFDGDHMSVIFPQHRDGIADVERMMISKNLINAKDGELIVAINQDMLLGLYWATMYHENKLVQGLSDTSPKFMYVIKDIDIGVPEFNPGDYHNVYFSQIWTDLELLKLDIHDFIIVVVDNIPYYSTVGRILLNSLIANRAAFRCTKSTPSNAPYIHEDWDHYYIPQFNSVICKDNVNDFTKTARLYCELNSDTVSQETGAFLDRVMDCGFLWSDQSGLTLSLFDFGDLQNRIGLQSFVSAASAEDANIKDYYSAGFLTKGECDKASGNTWLNTKSAVQQKLIDNLDRNSNLFIIIDSGARGNKAQLTEVVGVIGQVRDAHGNTMSTSVHGNYLSGLDSTEAFINAYTARGAVMSAQLNTANAGETTRQLIYLGEDKYISSDGRHVNCSSSPLRIKLQYNVSLLGAKEKSVELAPDGDTALLPSSEVESWDLFCNDIKNFGRSNILDKTAKSMICARNLSSILVKTSLGEVKAVNLKYSLAPISRSMLYFRCFNPEEYGDLGTTLKNASGDRYDMPVVTDSVISEIEANRLPEFKIYTMIGCMHEKGICARCYGLDYEKKTFMAPGTYIGYTEMQAISEPTAQLYLDMHKSTDNNRAQGIQVFKEMLSKPFGDNNTDFADYADVSGTVSCTMTDSGIKLIISDDGITGAPHYVKDIESLVVFPGESVKVGDSLTGGRANIGKLSLIDGNMAKVQMWLDYMAAYDGAIFGRNLELLVLSQSKFGIACEDQEETCIFAGKVYPQDKLVKAGVPYQPTILGQSRAMSQSEKVFAAVAKGNGHMLVGHFGTLLTKNPPSSRIAHNLLGKQESELLSGMPDTTFRNRGHGDSNRKETLPEFTSEFNRKRNRAKHRVVLGGAKEITSEFTDTPKNINNSENQEDSEVEFTDKFSSKPKSINSSDEFAQTDSETHAFS